MKLALSLLTSAGTILCIWLAGRKSVWAWPVGLFNQLFWATFIVMFEAWGLAPLAVVLTGQHTWNLIKWGRDAVTPIVSTPVIPKIRLRIEPADWFACSCREGVILSFDDV